MDFTQIVTDVKLNNEKFITYVIKWFYICNKLVFIFTFFQTKSYAQECKTIQINGIVNDTFQKQPFYNLMLINQTTGKGIFGQPDGNFTLVADLNDSIVISVKGYTKKKFFVANQKNCKMELYVVLQPIVQTQKEVVVKPIKSIQQIKEERASLIKKETKITSGVEVFESPITAIYERFSKKVKSKQKVADLKFVDDQRKVLQEILRTYVAYEIIDLDSENFDNFISFLNIDANFLRQANDIELVRFIKDKFEHFNIENRKNKN